MGRAPAKAGLPIDLHFHVLRHTGNTLTGEAGASLAELMSRMGHASARAAKVYLHARGERDLQLAPALDKLARRATASSPQPARSALNYISSPIRSIHAPVPSRTGLDPAGARSAAAPPAFRDSAPL